MQAGSLDQEDLLEEGMATHSSIVTWRIPWTEETGKLQSIDSSQSVTYSNASTKKKDLHSESTLVSAICSRVHSVSLGTDSVGCKLLYY